MSPQEKRNSGSEGRDEGEANCQRSWIKRHQCGHLSKTRHQERLKLLRGCRHGYGGLGIFGKLIGALNAATRRTLVAATTGLLNGRGVQG
jgi:hypothetical protein